MPADADGMHGPVNPDALSRAGLYDAEAPDAAERLELLQHLLQRGASIELIQERLAEGDELFMVATSLTQTWPRARSIRALAEEAAADPELVARLRLALGFPVDDLDSPSVRHMVREDVDLFSFAAPTFGEDRLFAFARVVGASAARIADAANALLGDRYSEERPTLLELSEANELAIAALQAMPAVLGRAVIGHLERIVRRLPDVMDEALHTSVGSWTWWALRSGPSGSPQPSMPRLCRGSRRSRGTRRRCSGVGWSR
jgi:hypothetical protein